MNRVQDEKNQEVLIVRKKIKNMYLRVLPDHTVKVSAPVEISNQELESFILSNQDWIRQRKAYFANQKPEVVHTYQNGELHYLWGRQYILKLRFFSEKEDAAQTRVYINDDSLILPVRQNASAQERERLLNDWYRVNLKEAVSAVLPKCESIVGKQAEEWRIKNMRTRWGSCNIREKRIWVNLQLAKKPIDCLEYVIIHELVHLYERNHNNSFKRYMDRFCPNWRKIKTVLNQ